MKQIQFLLCGLLFFNVLIAQDAYHSNLVANLNSDYGLPNGDWLIADNEVAIFNSVINWGNNESVISVSDQDFASVSQIVVNQGGNNPWDSGWKIGNVAPVQDEDKVLLVLWLRSEGGPGKVNVFVERGSTFEKQIYFTVNLSEEWTQFLLPFEADGSYSPTQLDMGLHLAFQGQTVQVGGFTAINYGNSVNLSDLPSEFHNDKYGGYEEDAPWRAEAATRIENLRKANLLIKAEQSNGGEPVASAIFDVKMINHEFAFGSAITAARIAGNNNQNAFYENKIINLDGNGHGFNWVVFENDMKWDGWEESWFVSNDELVNAVSWLTERGVKVRGHNLVWPGWGNLPDDLQANANNPDYIWDRIDGRLNDILTYPGLGDNVPEWDALNEIVTNTDLEPVFQGQLGNPTGRKIYSDIFKRAKEISPQTKLYLNDFVTISLGNTGGGQYDILKNRIQELLDDGAPVDGIGFQAHVGGFPNGIPSVLATYDDFYNSFGLTAKVTEFDLPIIVDGELGARYLRDFLTATFSHESMDGFLFWSFWDGATYMNPGANLFRLDWSRSEVGDMFVDLVFNEWWTDTLAVTTENGEAIIRGFKGTYEITYECNGETITEMITLDEDKELTVSCDNLQTNTTDLDGGASLFKVSPNPARNFVRIEKGDNQVSTLRLYDVLGQSIVVQNIQDRVNDIFFDVAPGVYFLELSTEDSSDLQKLVIE